jgi:hypothetical protein
MDQDRRLRNVGTVEFFFRALEAQLAQVETQQIVGLLKHGLCLWVLFGKVLAHPHVLGALAREQ